MSISHSTWERVEGPSCHHITVRNTLHFEKKKEIDNLVWDNSVLSLSVPSFSRRVGLPYNSQDALSAALNMLISDQFNKLLRIGITCMMLRISNKR